MDLKYFLLSRTHPGSEAFVSLYIWYDCTWRSPSESSLTFLLMSTHTHLPGTWYTVYHSCSKYPRPQNASTALSFFFFHFSLEKTRKLYIRYVSRPGWITSFFVVYEVNDFFVSLHVFSFFPSETCFHDFFLILFSLFHSFPLFFLPLSRFLLPAFTFFASQLVNAALVGRRRFKNGWMGPQQRRKIWRTGEQS